MYRYKAQVFRVVDAKTMDLFIDLGFNIHYNIRIRVADWDVPETRTRGPQEKKLGTTLTDVAEELVLGMDVIVETTKTESLNGWIAKLTLEDGTDYVDIMKEEVRLLTEKSE